MADTSAACSSTALAHDEPLVGTASLVRSWLLFEHPGAWGADALRQSRLDPEVARLLALRARRHDVRVILLRRSDVTVPSRRHLFAVHSAGPRPWIKERQLAADGQVLDVDLASVAAGRPPGFGTVRREPLFLVCTHSRHDPCCGRIGRPTARALADVVGEAAWECSHIGGERFAANLVCFPHGLYFGRVGPEEAPAIAAGYRRGRIELDHYRGRAGYPFVAQAAELLARRQLGLGGVDDLLYRSHRRDGTDIDVSFSTAAGSVLHVRVRRAPAPEARALTCAASTLAHPWTYDLLAIGDR